MKLVWSNLARQELEALRRYSIDNWGAVVARRYLEDIRDAARLVAGQPGRARPLRGPFRIFRVRSHYLIVHVEDERLTVARVLHSRMDIERHLPSE
ncbi:type II toxin-antitoxin system RelE/ParE family toxin [Sandarakinorhabdus sp.]|uniref:type II toxin-antitoxin system RelE/ParE family toxin n=1 Tax=Sandarakinorhabdus sp. TaxID=1916663 RepID=UPI003F7087CA